MATVRIQVRRGTSADWSNVNPVLAAGEMGLETNTRKIKVGDGSTAWNSLDYVAADAPAIGEIAQDAINDALELGSGLTKTYNDGANTITIDIDTDVIATQNYVDSAISSLHGTVDSSYIPMTDRGSANGVASLDSNVLVPNIQIDEAHWATKTYAAGYANSSVSNHNSATTNVHGISNTADLATKSYVDTAASNAVASVVDSAPSALNTLKELANALNDDENFASTVTSGLDSKLNKSGGTMSGAIAMGNNKITGLATPTANSDAVTKYYADTLQAQDLAAREFHVNATTNVHGISNTADLATQTYVNDSVTSAVNTAKSYADSVTASSIDTLSSSVQSSLSTLSGEISDEITNRGTAVSGVQSNLTTHTSATTSVHGISNTANLVYTADSRLSDTRTPTDNTVSTAKIVDSAISTAKIADSAITSAKIADGTIVNGDISSSAAIAYSKLNLTGSITSSDIVDGTIATVDIADSAISTAKIANSAITSAKIADGTIVDADINASAAIAATKIAGTAVTQADTGTVTSTMIADGTIVNGDINASANIAATKIAGTAVTQADTGTVTSTMILDGTIVNGDINASAAIAQSKIANLTTDLAAKAALAGATFTGDVTVPNITVSGNLTVSGTTTTVSSTNLEVSDPLIYIATGNAANANDIGIVGHATVSGTYQHMGLVRDHADGKWKLFSGVTTEPSGGTISLTGATYDTLKAGTFEGNLTGNADTVTNGVYLTTAQTLTNKTLTAPIISTISNTGTLTLPTSTDTLIGKATTDTLTNKTFDTAGAGNSLKINGTAVTAVTGSGSVVFNTSPTLVTPTLGAATVTSIEFSDGKQSKEGVPSRTPINQQSGTTYTTVLTDRDSLVECSNTSAITVTIPPNSSVAYPVGTSIDILQTSTGQVTIAAGSGVTVNATPGLKLRTQWSSATLFKRATDTWVVLGDLSA